MQFNIIRVVELGENYGDSLYLSDVDGDGVNELIFRQSGGMFYNPMYRHGKYHGDISEENALHLRHSCIRADGTEVWHSGEAWKHEKPYNSHAADNMTRVADIDGDGKDEIVYLHHDRLCIARAENFELLRSVPVFDSAINMILFQKVKDGLNIILKGDGRSKWGYGRPFVCLNNKLELLWKHYYLNGGGHNVVVRDVDGDGEEEIFEGYNLIDHDGRILWYFDFPSHADRINVVDINGDGRDEVVYCTDNEDYVVFSADGEHLYTIADFPHPQRSTIGRFVPDSEGRRQNFMNNRATHGGSAMLDHMGNILWDFPCSGYSAPLKSKDSAREDLIFFEPGPGRLPPELQEQMKKRAAELGYENLPISGNDGFEPMILDGFGKILFRFPFLEESVDVTKWGIREALKVDHGAGFRIVCGDVDGDGEDEFLFFNRKRLYILKSAEPFPYTLSRTGD